MSYILDALRKSDQQRQREAAPLTRLAPTAEIEAKPPVISRNISIALVLLGIGIVIGWLQPWRSGDPAATPTPVLATLPAPSANRTEFEPPATSTEPPAARPSVAPPTHDMRAEAKAEATRVSPAPMPERLETIAPSASAPAQLDRALTEPLASAPQGTPNLTISMHSYATSPKDRMAMINGQILREGETFGDGLRLEQVTPSGVVVSYKGYRFSRAMR